MMIRIPDRGEIKASMKEKGKSDQRKENEGKLIIFHSPIIICVVKVVEGRIITSS